MASRRPPRARAARRRGARSAPDSDPPPAVERAGYAGRARRGTPRVRPGHRASPAPAHLRLRPPPTPVGAPARPAATRAQTSVRSCLATSSRIAWSSSCASTSRASASIPGEARSIGTVALADETDELFTALLLKASWVPLARRSAQPATELSLASLNIPPPIHMPDCVGAAAII